MFILGHLNCGPESHEGRPVINVRFDWRWHSKINTPKRSGAFFHEFTLPRTRPHQPSDAQTSFLLSSYTALGLANTLRHLHSVYLTRRGKRVKWTSSVKTVSLHSADKWVREAWNPISAKHPRRCLKTQKETLTPKDRLGSPFYTSLNSLMRK